MFLVGPEALARHHDSVRRLAELLAQGREYPPEADALPTVTERVLVGGILDAIAAQVFAGEIESLPSRAPELAQLVLVP